MFPAIYTLAFLLILLTRQAENVKFQQSSSQIVAKGTENLSIDCSHDDNSLSVMLWYQHKQRSHTMSLIGYGYARTDPYYEGQFEEQFKITRLVDGNKGALIVLRVNSSDSAVYFCAASTQ